MKLENLIHNSEKQFNSSLFAHAHSCMEGTQISWNWVSFFIYIFSHILKSLISFPLIYWIEKALFNSPFIKEGLAYLRFSQTFCQKILRSLVWPVLNLIFLNILHVWLCLHLFSVFDECTSRKKWTFGHDYFLYEKNVRWFFIFFE